MKRALAALLLIASLSLAFTSVASAYTTEKMTVQTKVKVPVQIYLPNNIQGKAPAVLLVHSSGGVNKVHEIYYASAFEKMGIATIVIDSFSPRGIHDTVKDQNSVPMFEMRNDAIAVLQAVARNPHIDPNKVAIMGFSKGAGVVMQTALSAFNRINGTQFAMFIAMYPPCNELRLNPKTTGRPIRILVGENDKYDDPKNCTDVVTALKANGADVELTVIPKAQHGWDVSTNPAHWRVPKGENYSGCRFIETKPRIWIEKRSGIEIANEHGALPNNRKMALSKCLTYGVSGGYSPTAAAQSLKLIKDYVMQVKAAGK